MNLDVCYAKQRHPETGCISTGYENLLRHEGVHGIDFANFQEQFDLDQAQSDSISPMNNFRSVGKAIEAVYPFIHFGYRRFGADEGAIKLGFVEDLLRQSRAVLVSLANGRFGEPGWHVVLVVDQTSQNLRFLEDAQTDGSPVWKKIAKNEFVRIHDAYDGGRDVAYIEL